jgi:flavin reductase (DIM6/NTAB) family NADH-FMN oxidoreductase RutF/DNA-binding IclR family transcriptional regulator
MSDVASTTIEATEWWRAVLAECPTGVAILSAMLPDGQPTAMVIGSFLAISQDPPLIGYFGDDSSATFRSLVDSDRFAVSVLGEEQDSLLRSFIRKDEHRFAQPGLIRTASGLLRVDDPVAWFEARTESVQRHGDHRLVVGRVEDFGVGSAASGSPVLYRRGGFGAFAVPADSIDARTVGDRLGAAQAAAETLEPVARSIERDIAITAMVGESIVVVGMAVCSSRESAGPNARSAVGVSLPFAAPIEPLFAAWASDRTRALWIERARHLVGAVDRPRVGAQLEAIRERGYAVSVDRDLSARFIGLITDPEVESESYARMWSDYASRTIESATSRLPLGDIAAIQVPVFDENGGVALALTVSDVGPFADDDDLDRFARTLREAAAAASTAVTRHPLGRSQSADGSHKRDP